MKNLLVLLSILTLSSSGLCAELVELEIDENYLIITDKIIKKIEIKDPSFIEIKPFFTMLNEKNLMLLNPKKTGATTFSLTAESEKYDFEIKIKPNKHKFDDFKITTKNGFSFLLLDKPPENLELDKPPFGE